MRGAKSTIVITSIVYALVLLVGIVFFFNNFSSSPELNFIFRIVSVGLFAYFLTYPLIVASSVNLNVPIWAKILLFVLYAALEAGLLYLSFLLFDDNTFMYNKDLSPEAFDNAANNFTTWYWIAMILMGAGNIAIFIVKLLKYWDDWTFALLVPFAPALPAVFVVILIFIIIHGVLSLFGIFADGSPNGSSSGYDYDYSSGSSSDGDSDDYSSGDSSDSRDGYLRSPGENYYDGQGILRSPGENYYDYSGILRSPGENYYDGNGILRSPGENYYDGNGILRSLDENYYDGGSN